MKTPSASAKHVHVTLLTGMLGVGLVVGPGLVLGLAASLPMSLVEHGWLWGTHLPARCAGDFACMATFLFTQPLVMAALFGAGSAFGLAAQRLAGSGAPTLAALVGGLTLYAGAYAAALATNTLGMPMDALLHDRIFHAAYPAWLVVAVTFGLVSAGVAGGLTLALGLVVRTPGMAWRAVLVAVVVGLAYVLVGGLVDRLPGWTIGLPERINNHAMPRVTFLSDLVIGSVGAMLALLLLARGGSRKEPGGQQPRRVVAWARAANHLETCVMIAFFLLAFCLSWGVWLPVALASHGWGCCSLYPSLATWVGSFGPSLAALLITAASGRATQVSACSSADPRERTAVCYRCPGSPWTCRRDPPERSAGSRRPR